MAKSSKSKKPVVSAASPNKKPSPKGRKGGDKVFMRNDELYRLFVDSIKDYAILMLDPTGHVLSWNPGAELMKGYHADEIIGKHFSIFYPREDVEHGKPEMELRVATDEGRFEDEGWRVRKDGSRFWASVITALHKDAEAGGLRQGDPRHHRAKAGEDALREAEERMRRSSTRRRRHHHHRRTRDRRVDEPGRRADLRLCRRGGRRPEHRHADARALSRRARRLPRELPAHRRSRRSSASAARSTAAARTARSSPWSWPSASSGWATGGSSPASSATSPSAQAVGGREGQVSRERQRGGVSPGDHQHGEFSQSPSSRPPGPRSRPPPSPRP